MGALGARTKADPTVQDRFVRRVRHQWIAARCFLGMLGVLLPCTCSGSFYLRRALPRSPRWDRGGPILAPRLCRDLCRRCHYLSADPVALSFALARTSPHRRILPFHIAENRKLSKLERSGKCDFCKNPCRADVLRD